MTRKLHRILSTPSPCPASTSWWLTCIVHWHFWTVGRLFLACWWTVLLYMMIFIIFDCLDSVEGEWRRFNFQLPPWWVSMSKEKWGKCMEPTFTPIRSWSSGSRFVVGRGFFPEVVKRAWKSNKIKKAFILEFANNLLAFIPETSPYTVKIHCSA